MTDHSHRHSVRVDRTPPVTAGQMAVRAASAPESRSPSWPAAMSAPKVPKRVSEEQLQQAAAYLRPRDWAVLADLKAFGFLTAANLQTLHFHNYANLEVAQRITRRDLRRLWLTGLIEPLQRRIGGLRAGSASYVWRLSAAGDRLLRGPDEPRARHKEPSLRFLDHRLCVATAVCVLTAAAHDGAFELLHAVPEPATWRRYATGYGPPEILKPDLFVVTAAGDFEDHWFIEVDRGTESTPTVITKCEQYERYRQTGTEQASAGLFPRVLWLVPDEHRVDQLRRALRRSRQLDTALFPVARQDELVETIKQLIQEGGDHA